MNTHAGKQKPRYGSLKNSGTRKQFPACRTREKQPVTPNPSNMYEKLILENQVEMLWALRALIKDDSMKKELLEQIMKTNEALKHFYP